MYFQYQTIHDYDTKQRKLLHVASSQTELYALGFHCTMHKYSSKK